MECAFLNLGFPLTCCIAEKVKSSGTTPTNSEDDYLTQETKVQDKWVKERIGQTIKDYESEMQANQARGNLVLMHAVNFRSFKQFLLQPRRGRGENRRKKRPGRPRKKKPITWT